MQTRLEQIIATHRAVAAADQRFVGELLEVAEDLPPSRGFRKALQVERGLSLIAEIKRRSPSAGALAPDLEPRSLASQYEVGGASCLSVLTDVEFFGGSVQDLQQARAAVSIPVLRKDFTVSEADVVDARIMGADAILLIVAALEDDELWRFGHLGERLGLDVLFEVHHENEIARALRAGATMIGVNQRDLHSFEIENALAERLRPLIPTHVMAVAESGIRTLQDVGRLAEAGYDAMLVGTALVTSNGPAESVRSFVDAGRV